MGAAECTASSCSHIPASQGFLAPLKQASCSDPPAIKDGLPLGKPRLTTPTPLPHLFLSLPHIPAARACSRCSSLTACLTHPPHPHTQQPTMRAASILALGCYAAVSSAKDVLDDIEESAQEATSSVASAVESVTSSAIAKPTFTVSIAIGSSATATEPMLTRCASLPTSKLLSSSSSPTTGNRGGRSHTQRRRAPRRSGHTMASGPLRSPLSSAALTATRVSSSRTRLPTTPSPASSTSPSPTRMTPSSSSTRSSSRLASSAVVPT
jgi:hypothetical protein